MLSMKKPYIKKISSISNFEVWLVDGKHIREHLDMEFTNFGHHYRFNFIPENELWIDQEKVPGEEEFYINHLLAEHRLMAQGVPYKDALRKAGIAEKKQRSKAIFSGKTLPPNCKKEDYIPWIHKKLLKEYSRQMNTWIVDGELVRGIFFIDFTEGGHDKVYDFIPLGEVWIDDDLAETEIKFVVLHELHERALMMQGLKYPEAHKRASQAEYYCRQHPEETKNKIQEELDRNKK